MGGQLDFRHRGRTNLVRPAHQLTKSTGKTPRNSASQMPSPQATQRARQSATTPVGSSPRRYRESP